MLEKERGRRLALMEPLICDAFGKVAKVVFDLVEGDVHEALVKMETDATECFIWEGSGVRAWDRYEAGGPIEAEDVELNVSPELSWMTREQLFAVLKMYHQGDGVQFVATSDPWKAFTRASEAPTATLYVMPKVADPLDLLVRIVLGKQDRTSTIVPKAALALAWQEATGIAMRSWVKTNQHRPLSDHPAFESVVQRLQPGLPGLYVIRTPPVPFSPILPAATYEHRAAVAVFETPEEYEECEKFYAETGAAFFEATPNFRNRPPFSYRPASLAGGIEEGQALIVQTPWPDIGAVSVYAMPTAILMAQPDLKAAGFRERYGVQFDKDMAAATAFWQRFPGKVTTKLGRTEHPRARRAG
ncbi:hypothetical protein [Acidisphaera sp. L21]|uniref:hypothetical protein n=1 Tax=Acidisphaera sp. L21 TaxID=1641851 RepID=UPI00131E0E85|nr:hypothetical protein [Acidisphaera sp. L21]